MKVFDEEGLWDEGLELIGSWCFLLYQKHLKVRNYPLRTLDIDFLIPFPYKGKKKIDLIAKLEKLGFILNFNPDGSFWLWNAELKVDFLSPKIGRETKKSQNIKQLSVRTTPLRFMNILLENKIIIKEDNIRIAIPAPLNFCLHKLLIAQRRKDKSKKLKDMEQAIYILEIVDEKQFKTTYNSFPKKWQKYILQSLKEAKIQIPLQEKNINKILDTLQS
ncbi:nucleotidyltransferase domain-containing protein [bacterium]|nr:nucleotidyltransferase domain-containing protein [bacterium]